MHVKVSREGDADVEPRAVDCFVDVARHDGRHADGALVRAALGPLVCKDDERVIEAVVPVGKSAGVWRPWIVVGVEEDEEDACCVRVGGEVLGVVEAGEEAVWWSREVVCEDEKLRGVLAFGVIEAGVHGAERELRRVVPGFALRVPWLRVAAHLLHNYLFHNLYFRSRTICTVAMTS